MALPREKRPGIGAATASPEDGRAFVTIEELLRLKHRAKGFSFQPRQPVHSLLTGRHASRLRGRGLNFEELRHYFEGDDTRTIDWPATARLGVPHVRVFTEERDRPVLLVVDQRSTMFFGSRRTMKSVAAAEVAALAAWRVTSLGDRVGAVVFGDSRMTGVKPGGRDMGAARVIHEVARQNQALGSSAVVDARDRLNAALRYAESMTTHDGLICFVTDASGVDEETDRIVTRLMAHNDAIAAFIFDPLEADLPDIGRAAVNSGDRQIEVETASASLRRRFAADFAGWRARLAALSRQRTIPVLPIATDSDVATQLRDLIGQRSARGSHRAEARR